MIGRNRLLLSHARLALTSVSKPKAFYNTCLKNTGICYQAIRSSTASARSAFEITNEENYHEHQRKTNEIDLNTDPFAVLVYPGSRVLQLKLPNTTEDVAFLTKFKGNDVLDYEIEAALVRQKKKNVGCNVLSLDMATRMIERLDAYNDNEAVSVVFFASSSLDLFSGGLFSDINAETGDDSDTIYQWAIKDNHRRAVERSIYGEITPTESEKELKLQKARQANDTVTFAPDYVSSVTAEQLRKLNQLADRVGRYHKTTVAVFGGVVAGTAYSVFGDSKYRLGTETTCFHIPELGRGLLPVGGLAYQLSNSCEEGCAIARYLAVSEHILRSHEMYAINMLTHVVEEAPYDTIGDCLGHTINDVPINGMSNFVVESAMDDILDTMHVGSEIDVSGHPVWNSLLLVPFEDVPLTYKDAKTGRDVPFDFGLQKPDENGNMPGPTDDEDFVGLIRDIEICFSNDNPSECVKALYGLKNTWGDANAKKLENLIANEPECIANWYTLTRLSRSVSVGEVRVKEIQISTEVLGVK